MSVSLSGCGKHLGRTPLGTCGAGNLLDQVEDCRNNEDVDGAREQHAADYDRAHDLARYRAAPDAVHSGTQPRMNANEVIRTGRKRSLAPSSAASARGCPLSYPSLANSTISI